jgi:hypothetical protein
MMNFRERKANDSIHSPLKYRGVRKFIDDLLLKPLGE